MSQLNPYGHVRANSCSALFYHFRTQLHQEPSQCWECSFQCEVIGSVKYKVVDIQLAALLRICHCYSLLHKLYEMNLLSGCTHLDEVADVWRSQTIRYLCSMIFMLLWQSTLLAALTRVCSSTNTDEFSSLSNLFPTSYDKYQNRDGSSNILVKNTSDPLAYLEGHFCNLEGQVDWYYASELIKQHHRRSNQTFHLLEKLFLSHYCIL